VVVSRFLAVPRYLTELKLISLPESTLKLLDKVRFLFMCLALLTGAAIILVNMWVARKRALRAAEEAAHQVEEVASTA
jgi:hypothetical protein